LDDLILRRTSLGDNPERALKIAPQLCELFDWDEEQKESEINRLEKFYNQISLYNISYSTNKSLIQ
jgi:glycerol-3-phosphate dehydrogenase